MIYFSNNILLNLKYFDMKNTHEYFQFINEIMRYFIRYFIILLTDWKYLWVLSVSKHFRFSKVLFEEYAILLIWYFQVCWALISSF